MVYIPEHFEEKNQKEIQKIIDNFPLATLIAFGSKGLSANHLPFIVDYNKHGSTTLLGHIALENQLFKENKNNDEVLVLYKAEDTYVSPNWYPTKKKTHKVVPTWNYQSVHFYGRIFFLQDLKSLLGIVGRLTKIHENRIMLNSDNFEKIDFDNLKGELVLCVTAEINTQLPEDIDKNEALELIQSVGIKKAYQVVKTKYKISRNAFYKLAMEIKND